ncbi:hypothetical protein BST11_16965 [Mycobacterium alsense]|uniref:Uncharacterized protein n=1 Tax=Mycobacterium alsense TaxID=324058 RepID=A0AA42C059_9MYCO|nr:hypothetical protein [Mycobacterium alsense]MCV7381460.1 hypothetical protein [Mycobacterium alsense]OQZ89520.1 hypothetical protein BST11_16965 [Mycobacterium alsense]
MTEKPQYMTIYCDAESHTSAPVGLFMRAPDDSPNQDALIHIELGRHEGLYIVAMFWRFPDVSRRWAPRMLTARGLAKRGGGRQPKWDRYRLKCDRCILTKTAREPGFSETLTMLANQGIVAASLSALIK